jgi:hypothetical protein
MQRPSLRAPEPAIRVKGIGVPDSPLHALTVALGEPLPESAAAGIDIELKVKVSCPAGCDLRGTPVTVMAGDAVLAGTQIATYSEMVNETDGFTFKAPAAAGEHPLSILISPHDDENTSHEASSFPILLKTMPHATTMAVWDTPAPAVVNSPFTVKVGVKCSAGCSLCGHLVEVRDESGVAVGHSALRLETWPESDSLYWTEIVLPAPLTPQVQRWTAVFTPVGLTLPHDEACSSFTFRTDKPPDHRVTIHVVARDSGAPLQDVEVRIGQYELFTDAKGIGSILVPKGAYDLEIRQDGYRASPISVTIDDDTTVTIEALRALTRAEIDDRMRKFEGYPRFDY